jgi:heme A synthase
VQVALGAFTVLSQRHVWINSAHVVGGALLLATSLVLTLRSWHVVLLPARSPATVAGRLAAPSMAAQAGPSSAGVGGARA